MNGPGPARRSVLAAMALAGGIGMPPVLARPAAAVAPQPTIRPRSDWADADPTGPMEEEAPGDVRFLLVHHTQTTNDYTADGAARQLRSMYSYHTGEKGWPDLAYNFLVDSFGTIWEGRAGSLEGPVKGDATGNSQGFAQLCCFIGDLTDQPPTAEAQASMSALLAWLAGKYSIDLFAGPTITFVSRGSNKWAAGETVTTDPVAGHRDMSLTECPGDGCYPLVRTTLLAGAQALVGPPPPAPVATATATAAPPPPAGGTVPPTGDGASASVSASATVSPPGPGVLPPPPEPEPAGVPTGTVAAAAAGGAAALAAGAALIARHRRVVGEELQASFRPSDGGTSTASPTPVENAVTEGTGAGSPATSSAVAEGEVVAGSTAAGSPEDRAVAAGGPSGWLPEKPTEIPDPGHTSGN